MGTANLLCDVLFQNVVRWCRRAAKRAPRLRATARYMAKSTPPPIDRHRGCDLIQRNAEKPPIGQRDEIATPQTTHFAMGPWIIRVESHQCRQAEGDTQSGLTMMKQVVEAAVGVVCRAEARELPCMVQRRLRVHGRMDAAGGRECPGGRDPAALQP